MSVRIILADDHRIMRVGLRAILEEQADMHVVGEADCARGALDLITAEKPDVAILDINLPDGSGLSIMPALHAASPNTRVLVLTAHAEPEMARRSLSAGIHGYMNKSAEPDEVVRAVRSLSRGRSCFSVPLDGFQLGEFLVGPAAEGSRELVRHSSARPLSDRERQVLELFALGLTHRQIADRLGVRVKTVETYRSRLGDKFGVRSREDLARCAAELGLSLHDASPGV